MYFILWAPVRQMLGYKLTEDRDPFESHRFQFNANPSSASQETVLPSLNQTVRYRVHNILPFFLIPNFMSPVHAPLFNNNIYLLQLGCYPVAVVNVNKTNVNKTNVNKTNVNKTNVNKTNANKTNANKTNVNKTNVNKTNVNKTNVSKTNVNNTNANKTNVNKTNKRSILIFIL